MTKREKAQLQAIADLEASAEKILVDIHGEAYNRDQNGNPNIAPTIAKFSTLLVFLSRQAEEESKRNLKMQKTIRNLTWVLVVLTVAMVVPPILSIFKEDSKAAPQAEPANP